jgi:hypothetical protein
MHFNANLVLSNQWSVGTILMGLYSFMLEEAPTYGSIVTSEQFKRKAAQDSLEFNVKNKYVDYILARLYRFTSHVLLLFRPTGHSASYFRN